MKKTYLFLTDGFEEIEALGTIDVLRRGGVEVVSVSLESEKRVVGAHQIPVEADALFVDTEFDNAEMLVIPGGTTKFNEHEGLKKLIDKFAKAGKPVAAICAAPMVLGGLGLLEGKKATAYPGFTEYLKGAKVVEKPVVVADNITTGRGPGLMFDFALELVEQLKGKEKRKEVAQGLLLKH